MFVSFVAFMRLATIINTIPKTINAKLKKNAASRTTKYQKNTPGTQPVVGQVSGPPVRRLMKSKIRPITVSPNPRV